MQLVCFYSKKTNFVFGPFWLILFCVLQCELANRLDLVSWEMLIISARFTSLLSMVSISHTWLFSPRLLNHVMKRGAASANVLGVVAVMYSALGTLLEKTRGVEDELNTLVSATSTGILFTSTSMFFVHIVSKTIYLLLNYISKFQEDWKNVLSVAV